uniref:Uncharacterized protein n=1 Tax=Anopheles minimus TaxID=112268 RepID=A0A182W3M3_9DIPT
MQTEAILLALTGLISVVITSPLAGKTAASLQQPSAVAAESGSLNMSKMGQDTGIQRLQKYCSVSTGDAGCAAFKEMIGVAVRNKITEVEHIIDRELSRTLSQTEDDEFCSDLSKTLKQLPPSLSSGTLEPFKRIPTCVGLCYVKETGLMDVCRALFAGYKLILQPVDKEEVHRQSMVVPVGNKPDSITNKSGFVKIVPAVAEVKNTNPSEIKLKTSLLTGNDTEKLTKTDNMDKNAKPATVLTPPPSDIRQAYKPKGDEKALVAAEADAGPKVHENASKEQPVQIPEQSPQEAVGPEKNEGNVEQQQGEIDDAGGDLAPFDDEPKLAGNTDAKGATQPGDDISDESEGIASPEEVNENGDDLELNGFQPVGKQPVEVPEKVKQDEFSENSKASDIVPGIDPFYEQKDSNFFTYFLFAMFSCAMLYVAYHNKSKLLALVVEGRRTNSGRGGFSKGRKHTAAYRKLDSNLEEAITSGSGSGGHSSSQIIY